MMKDLKKYLVFSLGQKESYAISVSEIHEITERIECVPTPKMQHYVKGLGSYRGHVITILDLAKRFNVEPIDQTRTIVVQIGENLVGLDVPRVESIIELQDKDEVIEYSSLFLNSNSCIGQVIRRDADNSLISIVNLQRIFNYGN